MSSSSSSSSSYCLPGSGDVIKPKGRRKKKQKKQLNYIERFNTYDITGRVVFLHVLPLLVKGILAQKVHNLYNIIGISKYLSDYSNRITAKLAIPNITYSTNITATKKFESAFVSVLDLKGTKHSLTTLPISGIKVFPDITSSFIISGKKAYEQGSTFEFVGKSKSLIKSSVAISGKKDIASLLMILGLLDKPKE